MLSVKQINESINQGRSLKFLAQSYSEFSATKLKRIRFGIERNRSFLNELALIYATIKLVSMAREVKKAYALSSTTDTHMRVFLRGGTVFPFPFQKKTPGKKEEKTTINILLTSNYRFYGNLERNLIDFFLKNSIRFQAPTIVIGRTGFEFLKVLGFSTQKTFLFKSDLPKNEELKALVAEITAFDRVLVYHSRFQSVLKQTPFIKDIKEAQFEVSIPKKPVDYIFEPEIDKMLAFFDTQISTILLEQTFLESELARTAARLISMSNAEDNANDFLSDQNVQLAGAKRTLFNAKLLESIASVLARNRKRMSHRQFGVSIT